MPSDDRPEDVPHDVVAFVKLDPLERLLDARVRIREGKLAAAI